MLEFSTFLSLWWCLVGQPWHRSPTVCGMWDPSVCRATGALTLDNGLMIVAVLLAPLVALQVSGILERRREQRGRRLAVFRTLMATRARKLGPEHVEALNMIDVEFGQSSEGDRNVVNSWKLYLDHLNRPPGTDPTWMSKADELLVEVLTHMGTSLGYNFDKVHIKNQTHSPRAQVDLENDQFTIRKGLISLLKGESSLPTRSVDTPGPRLPDPPDPRAGTPPKTD